MRRLAPVGLACFGLALAAPVASWAGEQPAPGRSASHQHRRGLFGLGRERLCPDCQRAQLKAKEGIEMPPPPPLPQGIVMEGGSCPSGVCGSGATVVGRAPGYAVASDSAPGYAVVGGPMPMADPAPVGVVQARGLATMMPGRGAPADMAVMPTSIPSAPEPLAQPGHNRPHVVSHALGLSALGRSRREQREKLRGQKHASIRYGDSADHQITDLPASMVYGRRWWH